MKSDSVSLRRPSISVIMPTYEAELYIRETLASLAAQTLPISQLVVSDDRSKDRTLELVKSFKETAPFAVKIVDHEPSGVTANYLNALQHVTGEIICVADQDDEWLPNKAEAIADAMQEQSVSLVCHDCLLVDDKLRSLNRTLRGDLERSTKLSQRINGGGELSNLKLFLRGGLPLLAHSLSFRHSLSKMLLNKPMHIQEWWFEEWLSCVALTQGRLKFVPEHLVKYRQHAKQTSGGFETPKAPIEQVIESKYASRIEKMEYCVMLAESQTSRNLTLRKYAKFLRARNAILLRPRSVTALVRSIQLLLSGDYFRYANGVNSFGLDLLSQLGNVQQG